MRGKLVAKQKIEAWLVRKRRAARRRVDPHNAQLIWGSTSCRKWCIETAQKELHAILEGVVERDFGDRYIEGDLCLRAIELVERPFDDAVSFRIGIDHDRIVRDIR